MRTLKIENPFHHVLLEYDEKKPETDYEKELVRRYVEFLNMMQDARGQMSRLKGQYYYEQMLREDAINSLDEIEERYHQVSSEVAIIMASGSIDMQNYPAMKEFFYRTNGAYLNYHKEKIDKLREVINANDVTFDKLLAWFEGIGEETPGEDKKLEEFENYANDLYRNYDNYSLDLCCFDEDKDKMLGKLGEADKEWNALFKLRDDLVKNSMPFVERIKALNDLAEQLQNDFGKMDGMYKSSLN